MESIPGFVFVPRQAGIPRSAGAFFSGTVEAQLGPGAWSVKLNGRVTTVATSLDLVPGQTLKLKLISQEKGRWVLQTLESPVRNSAHSSETTPLMAAFLSRGLPLVSEKLALWSRWLSQASVTDKEGWAASLEARGQGPTTSLTQGLQPWLTWLGDLEQGKNSPPPDEEFWDLWNSRKTIAGDPWVVIPLRWEYLGQEDGGLLQAHWNPQAQAIDQWNLTACPGGTAFRLEARTKPGELVLNWHFFDDQMRRLWEQKVQQLESGLSTPELRLRLRVLGHPIGVAASSLVRGIDVQV